MTNTNTNSAPGNNKKISTQKIKFTDYEIEKFQPSPFEWLTKEGKERDRRRYSLDVSRNSTLKGFSKLKLNEHILLDDLDTSWEVLAEPIQTIMRKYGIEKPYEKLKELTRGKEGINKDTIFKFIEGLDIPENDKKYLMELSPDKYVGKLFS